MKQFKTVFQFELMSYVKKKAYIVVTVLLMAIIAVALCIPAFQSTETRTDAKASAELTEVAYLDVSGDREMMADYNKVLAAQGVTLVAAGLSEQDLEQAVDAEQYDSALVKTDPLSYRRILRSTNMYDQFDADFSQTMQEQYKIDKLMQWGVSAQQIEDINAAQVMGETVITASGKDQSKNFLYAYILIFALYMAIILYGQFVASSVATEKSSRAMELLVTSADPKSLMFGKVLGAGTAGLLQFALVLGTGYLFYHINEPAFAENQLMQSVFAMPVSLMLYTILFFVLGFFLYAFLFAALGSLVSRMEDLSATITPITFFLIAALMIVMFSMSSGQIDNPAMIVCSFVPFTSPMAMFTRIALGNVAEWEIILSVAILVVSNIGVGLLSTGIYRLGVLMYGNPPKPREIVMMLKRSRQ